MPGAFNALFRTPFDGLWLSFRRPAALLAAWQPDEVRRCLMEAEQAAREGAYAVGFVSYEAAAAFGLPTKRTAPGGLPLAYFGIFPRDRVERHDGPRIEKTSDGQACGWNARLDEHEHAAAVRRIKNYIADGDTYQLNFTFPLRTPFAGDAFGLFADLVAAQRGGWSAYLDLGTHAICSASPELFFLLDNGRIECRPMKGTAPRALTSADDCARGAELRGSSKNRAENVMIVDLTRNDLGRVARVGTVAVRSLFDVERYPQHWQMTSTVTADVGQTAIADIVAALFPSGSVTGAPKHRSMEIIRELETSPRGIYTGAIGMIAPQGRAHFNVAIRTVVVDRVAGEAAFGVGSAIVWDSTSREEYDECHVKAAILTARPPRFQLLETLRWDPGTGYWLLNRHLWRLRESASYFGFRFAPAAVIDELNRIVSGRTTAAKIRLLAGPSGDIRCEILEMPPGASAALRTALATTPISTSDLFLYHKTTHRAIYDRARGTRPDVDAVLLWNEAGEVTEATDANVVFELDGRRLTPPVECGLLPGTFRAELLEAGKIVEQRVLLSHLGRATRMWLINSVRGWVLAKLPRLPEEGSIGAAACTSMSGS